MFVEPRLLRELLLRGIEVSESNGFDVSEVAASVDSLTDSLDEIMAAAATLAALPAIRSDWPYSEPDHLDEIRNEAGPAESGSTALVIPSATVAARARTAFLGSVCGCILGKPVEVSATKDELMGAVRRADAWPLTGYVPERVLEELGRRHPDWTRTVRERIVAVAPDDDINYTVIGMLVLERFGLSFTRDQLADVWLHPLPIGWAWGAERWFYLNAGAHSFMRDQHFAAGDRDFDSWVAVLNPYSQQCGALIRADAYGYACPGNPSLAAELAWRDASMTHRGTGIYGAMFSAAAIATALVADDMEDVIVSALGVLPQRSRLYEAASFAFAQVRERPGWEVGNERIRSRYGAYGHCEIYQEVGTVINTLMSAPNVHEGLVVQVLQGNDTDSFGATAGSILGAFFGPDGLDGAWLEPFHDRIDLALADFGENRLGRLADRMGSLAGNVSV